jgi:maleylacetoacetate isomerase
MTATLFQFWRSSASWRVRWALAHKRVPFETVVVDLGAAEQRGDAHRARNPIGHVPALEIDGHTLAESVAIVEYLEETRPEPALYPRDPYRRALVRQVVELVNSGIQPLQNVTPQAHHSADPEEQRAWAAHFNERGMRALEALLGRIATELGGGRFCVGDEFTAADLYLVPQVYSARRFGVEMTPFARVVAVDAAARATEHADGAHPRNQPGAPPDAK